ncbi:hypothetical protein C8A01DRAFT_47974 [Parachaetomium inaequale]|uniref:Nephrocystin 3-like N-terminal domain-containing protein n=1 Tax=Parachaetomium inaequale TaxID=2588326 RepID=A0AAN6SQH4_9PEZI|nr:hypothetical protein C8A01DRAFT_47974 [Parachaetomium inaequale]
MRFKSDKSVSSKDTLPQSQASFPSIHPKEDSVPAGTEASSDQFEHYPLPDRRHRVHEAAKGMPPTASGPFKAHGTSFESHSSPQPQRTLDRQDDPLGLLVLYAPPERTIDIVFIHGLGGTSLRTWCRDRHVDHLWPKLWLPDELPTARVLTFGYNAHFTSRKGRVSSTIGDFATDLLFRMKYGENTPERLGEVPIIVVAHSMGGLVFKKALVQGHLNPEFNEIVSMIKAVLFLATPHRGTDLAETLNKALSAASIFGHSPKKYVTELARRSPTVDELNEAFRHHAPRLRIFSFYETLTTPVGPFSIMIVDKPTAVMGYSNETPAPLTANHHDVCKFTSPDDPNYASVIGALRNAAESVLSPINDAASKEDLKHITGLFGRSTRKQGTCEGFLASQEVESWLHSKPRRVLWVHAQPGGGKSTLCSLVIESLLEAGHHCSYFFFKYGQRNKQSTGDMLRSIAYQTALQSPAFRRALVGIAKSGVRLSSASPITVWEKTEKPFNTVVDLISRIAEFDSHVRVLVFSRPLASINRAFQLAQRRVDDDIRSMVAEEMNYLLAGDDFRAETVNEIVERSHGSFLWASLVTENVVKCHRVEQHLYDRMTNAALAKILLTWATYAKTPITVDELLEVHPEAFDSIMDLNHTINQVSGQFVVVNTQGQYLQNANSGQFTLTNLERANEDLFGKSLATLCDKGLRRKLHTLQVPRFLPYAATSWPSHLQGCSPESAHVLDALVSFFSGPYPLAWIQYLAMSGRLPELFAASRELTRYRPNLIYQCIPALSPASSIIHQKFNKNPAATLSVSGLTYAQWDDCLARVSGSHGTSQHVATSPLYMAVTLVWKVSDWSLQISAENPRLTKALAFRFDGSDTLMMVTEFRRLLKLPTRTTEVSPVWEKQDPALLNETPRPSCVAFNSDCTQIAVSYSRFPVSIWTVHPANMVARLRNRSEHERRLMVSHTGNSQVAWHPSGTQVLCVYGKAFKWNFEDDTYEEVKDQTGGDPHGLACSPDGRVFMTVNARGTIMIYDFSSMLLIHMLSTEGSTAQICFSPDSLRFYDLRGSYCNIWEPSCLLQLADEASEQVSDTETVTDRFWSDTDETLYTAILPPVSASHVQTRPAITAIEPGQASNGLLIAHGNYDGSINVYDTLGKQKHEIRKIDFRMTVERFAWSPKHNRLAYSLDNGATAVTTMASDLDSSGERVLADEVIYSDKNSHTERWRTHRLLFHGTGNRLLISGKNKCQVLGLPDGVVLAEQQRAEDDEPRDWQQHPFQAKHLLCFTANSVTAFSWDTLEPTTAISLDLSSSTAGTDSDQPHVTIDTILDNHSPKYLLLRTATTVLGLPRYSFVALSATEIYLRTANAPESPPLVNSGPDQTASIKPLPLPPSLTNRITHALGILPDGRLVFLDRQLWVCTTPLQRHQTPLLSTPRLGDCRGAADVSGPAGRDGALSVQGAGCGSEGGVGAGLLIIWV